MLFTEERIRKLLVSERDGFDFIEKTRVRYILYVFDREDCFEVRLIQEYLDHYNHKVEDIALEHWYLSPTDEINYKVDLLPLILSSLNKHGLLEGGTTNA